MSNFFRQTNELTYLHLRYIVFKENSHFSKLEKTWKKGKSPPSFELEGFDKAELCIIKCMKYYLSISNACRKGETIKLILSYVGPHPPVAVDTVSLGLKELLRLSGIDTSIFIAHSTRTISASKSKQVGLSFTKILKTE